MKELAKDFGIDGAAGQGGLTLYAALCASERSEVCEALEDWRALVACAGGHDLGRASPALVALAASYGVAPGALRPAELLFAAHSYYALVVKLIVGQVLAHRRRQRLPSGAILQARSGREIRAVLEGLALARGNPMSCATACPGTALDPTLLADHGTAGRLGQAVSLGSAGLDNKSSQAVAHPRTSSHEAADPFSWYLAAWSEPIEQLVRRLAGLLDAFDPAALAQAPLEGQDLFQGLYQRIFPRRVRHAMGEYYTPEWLAAQMLDEAGYSGQSGQRLLDPACGSGTFLLLAIRRLRARLAEDNGAAVVDPAQLRQAVVANLAGLDLNPLAVMTARANVLLALEEAVPATEVAEIPIYLADSILGPDVGHAPEVGKFDYVVGNPPWIAWDDLPDDYREATKPLWKRYGLFSLSGAEARHGGGKKDLAMLMTYAAADHFLKDGGRVALVITQTLFQTKGAGDGFRRFRLGEEGAWLRVLRVNDLVDLRPFPGAANWTATILLEKGRPTIYPVPYVRWSPEVNGDCGAGVPPASGVSGSRDGRTTRSGSRDGQPSHGAHCREYAARPIDPARPGSPWFLWPEGWNGRTENLFGPSEYQAHLGANSGGANGVYWVELLSETGEPDSRTTPGGVRVRNIPGQGKRQVSLVERAVEAELVYPLLRWGDIERYRAVPRGHLLLPQDVRTRRGIDEATMREKYPLAYTYLEQFREVLVTRTAYRRYQSQAAFYSMYDVGPYTLAPIKVVWRRMDRRVNAAVIDGYVDPCLGARPVVPQETCVLVAADSSDEAHYLCALLNSAVVGFLVRSHSVRGGKGFGTPSMLEYLRLARFDPNHSIHGQLAAASRKAHTMAADRGEVDEIDPYIDELAGRLWELGPGERRLIEGH